MPEISMIYILHLELGIEIVRLVNMKLRHDFSTHHEL